MIKGVDLSHWNVVDDFKKLKRDGIDFVILKAGGSDKNFYEDSCFNTYYHYARQAGLYVGAYYFVGPRFLGREAGKADADRFLRILKGKKFQYPVYVDIETTPRKEKEKATEAAFEFCERMENNGAFVGIYSSDISGFKERLNLERLKFFTLWVARYGARPTYAKSWDIWQSTSTARVDGVRGVVDLDFSLKKFHEIIKREGCNDFR